MPYVSTKNGVARVRGAVMVAGIERRKWFPDDSKTSWRAAVVWEEAERKLLEAEAEKEPETTPTVSLLEWSTAHLDAVQADCQPKTYISKRIVLRRFIQWFKNPDASPEEITTATAFRYLQTQAKERSPNAANKDRKELAVAWSWGAQYLDGFPRETANPFLAVKRFTEKRSPRYVPPEQDFWQVLDASTGQDRVMLLAFIYTAARRGEIFRLKWADVDFARGLVCLQTVKTRDKSVRRDWLPMTKELKTALLWWWENRENKRSEYVFTILDKTPYTNQFEGGPFKVRQHWLKKMCESVGVKPFGYHAIRHLTATTLYRLGYPAAVIQAVLRHEQATTTARYIKGLGTTEVKAPLEALAARRPGRVVKMDRDTLASSGE